jgi:glycogen debranching enzyme
MAISHMREYLCRTLDYGAYCAAGDMAEALGRDYQEVQRWRELAAALKQKTDEHLWMPDQHRYGYLIHGKGLQSSDSPRTSCGLRTG